MYLILCLSAEMSEMCSGFMVIALDSGSNSPEREDCVMFLGKTLNSRSASLHPGV